MDSTAIEWLRRRGGGDPRDALRSAAIWLLPVLVLLAVYYAPTHPLSVKRAIAYLAALLIVVIAASRPAGSLLLLIGLLPFQGLLLAKLWAWGLPTSLAKDLGSWKEALAIGVILAGARGWLASRRPADGVDKLAFAFVILALLYCLLGREIVPGSPGSLSVRVLGFRETAGFVLLLLGARHARLPAGFADRATRWLLIAGVVVAGVAIYEAISPDAWNRFVVGTMEYTRYQVTVLGTVPNNMWNILTYGQLGGGQVVRSGSVFLNALTAGFYLLIPFAVGFERTLRRTTPWTGLFPTLVIAAGLILTETRSAIIGALLIATLAFQPAAGRPRHFRVQVALVLGTLALIAVPAAIGSGALKRFSLLSNSGNSDTQGHESGFWDGVKTIGHHPLGLGLATGAGTGQRFEVQGDTIPEDNYLEVGAELGILGGILFIGLTVALILRLRRSVHSRDDPLLAGMWAASAGLAVSALFLQTWLDFSVSWTFWGLTGAMLGLSAQRARA
jgi:hypothetical protein